MFQGTQNRLQFSHVLNSQKIPMGVTSPDEPYSNFTHALFSLGHILHKSTHGAKTKHDPSSPLPQRGQGMEGM